MISRTERILAGSLIGVIVSLLMVGVVSSTPVRHIIQVTPVALALAAVAGRRAWAAYAAFPVLLFWLLIMLAIWAFLLGLARIVTGHFTTTEVVLTVLIGLSSVCGIAASVTSRSIPGLTKGLAALVLFAALQLGALWMSMQPLFARR